MSKTLVVVGTQWGDEGKGKIVDWLTERADAVVRFQGGHNAGHTLYIGGKKTVLRLVPSGVMHDGVACYLGNGVVVAPQPLLDEIEALEQQGISVRDRFRISVHASLILPSHILLDKARESCSKGKAIGTTGRGIGPAYEDKIARRAIKLADLNDPDYLAQRLEVLLDYHNFLLTQQFELPAVDGKAVHDELCQHAEAIKPMISDVVADLAEHRRRGDAILFEGAQGVFLDIDHGSYPYVTSSNTCIGSVTNGAGVGPRHIDYVLGITKAYTTRVGGGPFPTELDDQVGTHLADTGKEFGAVTGRPRRCGWLDLVVLRRAIDINSITALCITKLDVLDKLPEIKLCTSYTNAAGEPVKYPPATLLGYKGIIPEYQTLPGWQCDTAGITNYDDLPDAAKYFLRTIEQLLAVPIHLISTGAERDNLIVNAQPWECL